ncbi:MAG: cellulase family glycosylhydrolase [Planctomycetota bacterium]
MTNRLQNLAGWPLLVTVAISGSVLSLPAASQTRSSSTTAELAIRRLTRGINVDVSLPQAGSPEKVLYDPAQYDAVKAAGFQSVRFFVSATDDPAIYENRIRDALDRDLAVIICVWGDREWSTRPDTGIDAFVSIWSRIATHYRDYPSDLVFELLNEPAGLATESDGAGSLSDGKTAMRFLNAVIPVIRATNRTRFLAIGGPGFNGASELQEFVTPTYLSYKLKDGTGFEDDDRMIGVFHLYHPYGFSHWTTSLKELPTWQAETEALINEAERWSEQWNKPVLMSEWGAWASPCHSDAEFAGYLKFIKEECERRNIGWIYYCAGFNNQWGFNLLHSDRGWDQTALGVLTGTRAPVVDPMSPLINSEFVWGTNHWSPLGTAKISLARDAGLSGPTALKVEASRSEQAEVYQQTQTREGSPPGRYLISVMKGQRYRFSFLAKPGRGDGCIRLSLSSVDSPTDRFWISDPIRVHSGKQAYTVEYVHHSPDANNVRLAFLFGEKDQTILLDKIDMRRVESR